MAAADTPISPVWRHFLAEEVCKIPFPRKSSAWWGSQDQETVGKDEVLEYTQDHLDAIAANKQAQWYSRCRLGFIQSFRERQSWFLDALRAQYRFVVIASPPRTGGTFLTKQLYRAMGVDPKMLPAYFGHDGYPNVPIDGSGKETSIAQFAEWLLQANHFLPVVRDPDGRSVLVLKTVKLVWDIETYLEILGPAAEWVVVERPARDVFASINEKAGRAALADTPLDPKINIERWIAAYWQIEHPDRSPDGLWEAFSSYYAGYRSRLQEKIPARQLIRIPYQADCLEGFVKDRVQRWGGVYQHEEFQVKSYDDHSII